MGVDGVQEYVAREEGGLLNARLTREKGGLKNQVYLGGASQEKKGKWIGGRWSVWRHRTAQTLFWA